jgi:hypothetical protein
MDDQTRRDLENIRRKAQEQRDHVRKLRLEAEAAEEREALAAEKDDLAELRDMFGAGFMKAVNEPAKFGLDPDVATNLIRAANKGQHRKVERLTRRHRREIKDASKKANSGCLPALVLMVGGLPALATAIAVAVHYL